MFASSRGGAKKERIPPIRNYTIDLTVLDEREQKALNDVIERDVAVNQAVDQRVTELRREIQSIRKAGALRTGDKQNKMCARCKFSFWPVLMRPMPVLDTGARCMSCKFRICKKCRFKQVNNLWLCSLCLKQRQEKWLTGEWLSSGQCRGLIGSDLLRASLRDRGILRVDPTKGGPIKGDPPKEAVRGNHGNHRGMLGHRRGGSTSSVSSASPRESPRSPRSPDQAPPIKQFLYTPPVTYKRAKGSAMSDTSDDSVSVRSEGGASIKSACSAVSAVSALSAVSARSSGGRSVRSTGGVSAMTSSPEMSVKSSDAVSVKSSGDVSIKSAGGVSNKSTGHYSASSEIGRDSDSGVNSGQTSRTATPEQRQGRVVNPGQKMPVISVTGAEADEHRGEEEDNLDELFSQHKNMMGSRNSLASGGRRASSESLYSIYSDAGEVNYGRIPVTGEVQFHLDYSHKNSVLEVHLKACKDLAPVDTKRNRSDPYIKTYLLPDKSRGSKRKSKIKKHTLNPNFDEILKYPITKGELESRTLWLTVWHSDRFGRNDFLGEVTIPMDYYDWERSRPAWYTLQTRTSQEEDTSLATYKGDMMISIKYVSADQIEQGKKKSKKSKSKSSGLGELHANIREAQNLTAMRGAAGSNPFCKGYLLPDEKHSSKQKTPVIKKTTNPKWGHTLVFEGVDLDLLQSQGLELTIWDHEKLASNDFLGGVRLNLGTVSYDDKAPDWMDARAEESEVWRSVINHPNEWIDATLPLRASMGKQTIKK